MNYNPYPIIRRQTPAIWIQTADHEFITKFEEVIEKLNRVEDPLIGIVKMSVGDYTNHRYISLNDEIFESTFNLAYVLVSNFNGNIIPAWECKDLLVEAIKIEMKLQAKMLGSIGIISGLILGACADNPQLRSNVDFLLKRAIDRSNNIIDLLPPDLGEAQGILIGIQDKIISEISDLKRNTLFNKNKIEDANKLLIHVQETIGFLQRNADTVEKLREYFSKFKDSKTCFDFDPKQYRDYLDIIRDLSETFREYRRNIPQKYFEQ